MAGCFLARRAALKLVAVSARRQGQENATSISPACAGRTIRYHSRRPTISTWWSSLIGGSGGVARRLVQKALASGKHVVTANKALLARMAPDCRRGRGQRAHARLRGGGGRRYSDHQGVARRAGRQPRPAPLRHPERHLQLHPHHRARDRSRLRCRAGRGIGQRVTPKPTRASMSTASTRRTSSPC